MLALEFPGCRILVDALDEAVNKDSTADITDALRSTLCSLIQQQDVMLPECVFQSNAEHYARRELYRSERYGYCV
jgi:hypothetical protein